MSKCQCNKVSNMCHNIECQEQQPGKCLNVSLLQLTEWALLLRMSDCSVLYCGCYCTE